MSLWQIAWLTCMQNVGALRMLGECSTRCHLEMWSLVMPWYWDMWNVAKARRHWNYFNNCNRRVCNQTLLVLWGCWKHVSAWLRLKRAGVFINKSFKVVWNLMCLWGVAWWTCMQSVGAWRMLGECSTRCHLKMWSLGMPDLEDVPWMGMVMKLLNILNRCVKVYNQMISLLFVFCQLVAMQVWWMKACTVMLQWSQTKWFLLTCNITHVWSTFLAMLAIYRRQRIWSWQCPVNHMWLHGWLCTELAEFMVMWRWQNALPTNSWTGAWKCYCLCATLKHLCCCWQQASLWECWAAEKGKRCEETARSHLDWSE